MAAKIIVNFGDFFLPQKSLKMRDVLEKMRECGKLPNLRDFPHDCGMVDTYGNETRLHGLALTETNGHSNSAVILGHSSGLSTWSECSSEVDPFTCHIYLAETGLIISLLLQFVQIVDNSGNFIWVFMFRLLMSLSVSGHYWGFLSVWVHCGLHNLSLVWLW